MRLLTFQKFNKLIVITRGENGAIYTWKQYYRMFIKKNLKIKDLTEFDLFAGGLFMDTLMGKQLENV